VPEGSSVLLQCAGHTNKKLSHQKDSKVLPNIRWRGPDGQDIGIDTFRVQLTNGSLYISAVNENRGLSGSYQCLLSVDGIGTIVSRMAKLSIAGRTFNYTLWVADNCLGIYLIKAEEIDTLKLENCLKHKI
jgi:neogenin